MKSNRPSSEKNLVIFLRKHQKLKINIICNLLQIVRVRNIMENDFIISIFLKLQVIKIVQMHSSMLVNLPKSYISHFLLLIYFKFIHRIIYENHFHVMTKKLDNKKNTKI